MVATPAAATVLTADRRHIVKALLEGVLYPIPSGLRSHHSTLSPAETRVVQDSIQTHFHTGWRAKENYSEAFYRQDLDRHLHLRLARDRRFVIPWLNAARDLRGMRVLEIGCGTGSS